MPPNVTDPFASEFIGVQAFLNEHSSANYSRYCLAYRFTSRDFNDGVVGLAYVGPQPGVNAAGQCICLGAIVLHVHLYISELKYKDIFI